MGRRIRENLPFCEIFRASFRRFPLMPDHLPQLRQDLRLHRSGALPDGSPVWRIADPVRNRFFEIGWLEFDVLLGDVSSLKQKRSIIRPIIAELHRKFAVSAAETGHLDLHRRSGIGMAVVAADSAHVVAVLDAAERLVAARPEIELLSVRRRLQRSDD